MQNTHEDTIAGDKDVAIKVYEISYVLLSSIPQEKVADEVTALKAILAKSGATIVAEENPEMTPLAYTMVKKIHGSNHRFDEGYFGWVKFELPSNAIASVKKAFDTAESVLRYLLLITVKENTYLGKRAPAYESGNREQGMIAPEVASGDVAAVAPVSEEAEKGTETVTKEA